MRESFREICFAEASVQASVEVASAKTFMEASIDDTEAMGAFLEVYESKRWKLTYKKWKIYMI